MRIPPRHRTALRRGLSLVEVMVALVLVAVGLLGIAGSSALMLRATTAQATAHHAARQARFRLAQLTAAGCHTAQPGRADDARTGLTESWSIQTLGTAALLVSDSIAWQGQGAPKRLVVRGAILC